MMNVNKHVGEFGRALGNGPAALANVAQSLHSVADSNHRDTTVLVRTFERAKEKQDDASARQVRFLSQQVFPGMKTGQDKNKRPTMKIAGIQPDTSVLEKIDQLVADGVALRSPKVKEAFADPDATTKKREATAVAKSVIRAAKKNGVSKDKLTKLINAMWNEVKVD